MKGVGFYHHGPSSTVIVRLPRAGKCRQSGVLAMWLVVKNQAELAVKKQANFAVKNQAEDHLRPACRTGPGIARPSTKITD
jgi:hypothetical protein